MSSESEFLAAFRQLCELLYRPTPARMQAGMAVDWSAYPRVAAAVDHGALEATPELLAHGMRTLLEEAYEELHPRFPSTESQLSSLDVVRLHLIEGQSWEAITTERMELGAPISARTLRSRQRDALEVILEWAATAPAASGAADASPATKKSVETTGASRSRFMRLPALASAAFALVVIAAWLWMSAGSDVDPRLHPAHVGAVMEFAPGQTTIEAPYPPYELPAFDTQVFRAMLVPLEEQRPGIVVITSQRDHHRAKVGLFDVNARRMRWLRSYDPPQDEILTHDTLPPEARLELFRPSFLYYGTQQVNLGATIAVVHEQNFSPCFVVIHSLETGEELGRYAHPGRFETGAVVDLDGDGRAELLLGGSENTFQPPRAVVAALDPTNLTGSASTVAWRTSPGEDALARTILPSVPALEDLITAMRFQVLNITAHSWNPVRGILSLDVGGGAGNTLFHAYKVYLKSDLQPLTPRAVHLGENEERMWDRAGLEYGFTENLDEQIVYVGGRWATSKSR